MSTRSNRRFLRVLGYLVSGLISLPAMAESLRVEEVHVKGVAKSYIDAVSSKRAAQGIVDQIAADDLGRLPDKNVGETLNRIPGVSMLLEKGEGRFVQIRGISPRLNNVTINGTSMGSPEADDGGRLAPMDMIGGELLSGVEIIKTARPDMDAQGIGGTLNLKTKMPFDYKEQYHTLLSARYGVDEINDSAKFESGSDPYSLSVTHVGKTNNNDLGWLLGASFSDREYLALGIFQDDWRQVTLNDGQAGEASIFYPEQVKNNYYIIGRERTNLNATLEWRPSKSASYYVRGFYSNWDEFQHRNRYQHGLDGARDDGTGLIEIINERSGVIAGNRISTNIRLETAEKEFTSFAIGGENAIQGWTIDYLAQLNENSLDEPYSYWEFRSGANTFGPDTFTIDGNGLANVISQGESTEDLTLQGFRRVRFQDKQMEESGTIAQFNTQKDLILPSVESAYLKFGAKYTLTSRELDYGVDRYNEGEDWSLAEDVSLSNGAFVNEVPIADRPNIWMNINALNAFFDDSANATLFEFDEEDTFISAHNSDYEIDETITAAYAMGVFDWGLVEVIAGVRVEQTDVDTKGYLINDTEVSSIERNGSYTDVLPSLITTFDLTDSLVLRAAWTNTLGRPEYEDIAPRSILEIDDIPNSDGEQMASLFIGNPDLVARSSSNFDLSLEWYFGEGSALTAAFFAKAIEDELVREDRDFTNYEFEGTVYEEFALDTTVNGKDAKLNGVEFTYVDQFEFLPGLGMALALTFIDSEIERERGGEIDTFPLEEQADQSTSITLFYSKAAWDAALTYNENGSFLTDLNGSPDEDLDQGKYGSYSFSAQYEVNQHLRVFVEGQNLNDEPTTEFQGGRESWNTEYEYVGRSYHFGVNVSF